MSKVYRIYPEGDNKIEGWKSQDSNPYDETNINKIEDPNGGDSKKEITSIPSPFARIDLVKTAFSEVAKACKGKKGKSLREELDKQTIYHKMISDSLDVGEIFFNLEKFKDKFEILVWSPDRLKNVENGSMGRKCYADALKTYWEADEETYHFKNVKNIYILNYKRGNRLCVVGATSPSTLFFSNANDLSDVRGVQIGEDKPFDDEYQPLYRRDPEYVKYLIGLSDSTRKFGNKMKELSEYLDLTSKALEDVWKQDDFNNFPDFSSENECPNGFKKITTVGSQVNDVEVLGFPLYQKALKEVTDSDFIIKSGKVPDCKYLVLPVDSGNIYEDWQYTTARWGKNQAPAFDERLLESRTLPNDGSKQPYLTISDFLESTILSTSHKLNNDLFYDGDFRSEKNSASYLLPLTPLFFKFFSAKELVDNKMILLERLNDSAVSVTLKVPTKKGVVKYNRVYTTQNSNIERNEGQIIKGELENSDVVVCPAIPMPENVTPYYAFNVIAPFGNVIDLKLFQNGQAVDTVGTPSNRNEDDRNANSNIGYTVNSEFECVQVRTSSGVSMAVPMFLTKKNKGTHQITYSVDLGTSNTHIEYVDVTENRRKCLPFEYKASENMVGLMFLPIKKEREGKIVEIGLESVKGTINRDLIPMSLGGESFHFPTRTILSYSSRIDWNSALNPFELYNVNFTFGKADETDGYNEFAKDLKWDENEYAENQISAYIRNLLFMLRNKTIALGGDLAKTSLVWFFPNSMKQKRLGQFQKIWNDEFKNFFGTEGQVYRISESSAPVAFHNEQESTVKDMLSIDIGGGTTDVAFASNGKIDCITSFRFAGNSLFEDSFKRNNQNGLVEYFEDEYLEKVAKGDSDLQKKLNDIFDKDSTAQVATSLFTLKEHPYVIRKKEKFPKDTVDFTKKLRDDDNFKLEFVIFYASILYHAGKIIKAKDMPLPRHIALSGNGSNILKALVTTDNYGRKELENFSKNVLEKSVGYKYQNGEKLGILGFGEDYSPKSATCKGGLFSNYEEGSDRLENVVLKYGYQFVKKEDTYANVNENFISEVFSETEEFFKTLKEVNKEYDFEENFGVTDEAWNVLDEILNAKNDIKTFISNGIKARQGKENSEISETFFFYPIASILQEFSNRMYDYLKEEK